MRIDYSRAFLRKVDKLPLKEQKRLSERIEWFKNNSKDPRLKVHMLSGKMKGYFSFSLDYSKRTIFVWIESNTVLFVDVGSHEDVYK